MSRPSLSLVVNVNNKSLFTKFTSLPTPPSTKSNRSQHRNNFHFHADPGIPTPSTSTHKRHVSHRRSNHRTSPFPESQRHGTNIQNIQLLEEAESSSSEVEEDATTSASAISDRRWLGRRGSRRPGLTFAQQMGLIAARATEQHQPSLTTIADTEWESTGDQRKEKKEVNASLWLNTRNGVATHIRDMHNDTARSETSFGNAGGFSTSHNGTTEPNPFLDEKDVMSTSALKRSCGSLRKSASGTLLDPVDIVAASPTSIGTQKRDYTSSSHRSGAKSSSTFVPIEYIVEASTRVHIEEDGSETEKEENGDDEEEDDSPYLIEHHEDTGNHLEMPEKESHGPITSQDYHTHTDDPFDQQSDLSEMSELDEDDEEEEAEADEEFEPHEGPSEVDDRRSLSRYTSLEAKDGRPPSITRYLSASKSSGSSSLSSEISKGQAEPSTIPSSRTSPKLSRINNRERKAWSKPTVGDVNENPFLATSGTASSSWLRTDNARMQRREGEKPTIDYVL